MIIDICIKTCKELVIQTNMCKTKINDYHSTLWDVLKEYQNMNLSVKNKIRHILICC